ncbi:hypothetical protein CPSG_08152 [Coccidioides posadasii str. Silveira]|uniref:Uncharacterized protein n=1 Tax=Coccidioides posadasii (strain RMSCC 757 / Silveira) TaxID=443226 RepID=E9DDJ0_COCPS|nr:hypothetical protein CPSG_08152 [Coccidioides posadasii str. Silveira]
MGEIPFSQGSIRNQGVNIRIVSQPSKGDNVACRGTQIPGARASSLSRVYAVTNHASTAPRQVRDVHTYANERHAFLSPKATHYSLYFRLRLVSAGSAFARFLGQLFTRIVSRCIALQRTGKGRSRWDSCSKIPRGAEGWKSDPDIRQLSDVPGVAASPFAWKICSNSGPTLLHRSSRRRRHKARDGRVRNDEEMRNIKLDLVLGWHPGSQRTIPSFSVSLASNGPPAFPAAVRRVGGSLNAVARDWLWFRVSCAVNPGPTPPYFRAAKACAQCYLPARSRSFSPRKVNDSAPSGYKGKTSLDTANEEEKIYPTANVLEAALARKLPVLPLTLQPSVIAMNRSQIVLAQNFLLTQSTSARNGLWLAKPPSFVRRVLRLGDLVVLYSAPQVLICFPSLVQQT